MKGKIHRATVTQADLDYEGSISIDHDLMDAAGLLTHEQVDVLNITNGERLTTYVIEGPRGSGMIGINGAAAHKMRVNDLVIICAYARMSEEEAKVYVPKVVLVDANNAIKEQGRLEQYGKKVA
jgi:aspartate 1-decarboxylase